MTTQNHTGVNASARQFFEFFTGFENAKGRFTITSKEARGKITGNASTIKEAPSIADWEGHLAGVAGVGIIPIMQDECCYFGALDIDDHSINLAELEENCGGLPVVIARSKSGGAHVYMFFSEPVPARLVRSKLSELAQLLNVAGCEIFPKQEQRKNVDEIGNWLNMPYFNSANTERFMISKGKQLSVQEALEIIASKRITLEQFLRIELTAKAEPEYEGTKNYAGRNALLFASGMRLRKVFDDHEFVRNGLYQINATADDKYHGNFELGGIPERELDALIKSVMKEKYAPKSAGVKMPITPMPLYRKLSPAIDFPIDALTATLKSAAIAIQDITRAPMSICAQSVLAAATLATQGHAIRLAAVLSLFDDLQQHKISVDYLQRGIELTRYYAREALRLYQNDAVSNNLTLAQKLLRWLHSSDRDVISLVDIYQYGPNRLRDAAKAKTIATILENHGWLQKLEDGAVIDGKHRTDVWRIVPKIEAAN